MEGRRSNLRAIPANFVSLRNLQEMRLKEKEAEGEEERRRLMEQQEDEDRLRRRSEREEEEQRNLAEAAQSLELRGPGVTEGRVSEGASAVGKPSWKRWKKKAVAGESPVIVEPTVDPAMPESEARVINRPGDRFKARSSGALTKINKATKDGPATIVVGALVIGESSVDSAMPESKARVITRRGDGVKAKSSAARTKENKVKNYGQAAIVVGELVIGAPIVDSAMPESDATVISSRGDGVKTRSSAARKKKNKGKKKDVPAAVVAGEGVIGEPTPDPALPVSEARVINSRGGDGVKARSSAAVKSRSRQGNVSGKWMAPPARSSSAGQVWVPKSS